MESSKIDATNYSSWHPWPTKRCHVQEHITSKAISCKLPDTPLMIKAFFVKSLNQTLDANTNINLSPESVTVSRPADAGVPGSKLVDGDAVEVRDGPAVLHGLDKVERLAVGHHASLDGRRRGDGMNSTGRGCAGGGSSGGGRRTGKDTNTGKVVGPQTGAVAQGGRVPFHKLGNLDAVEIRDDPAVLEGLDQVEAVAVGHHAVLDGRGRRDAGDSGGRRNVIVGASTLGMGGEITLGVGNGDSEPFSLGIMRSAPRNAARGGQDLNRLAPLLPKGRDGREIVGRIAVEHALGGGSGEVTPGLGVGDPALEEVGRLSALLALVPGVVVDAIQDVAGRLRHVDKVLRDVFGHALPRVLSCAELDYGRFAAKDSRTCKRRRGGGCRLLSSQEACRRWCIRQKPTHCAADRGGEHEDGFDVHHLVERPLTTVQIPAAVSELRRGVTESVRLPKMRGNGTVK